MTEGGNSKEAAHVWMCVCSVIPWQQQWFNINMRREPKGKYLTRRLTNVTPSVCRRQLVHTTLPQKRDLQRIPIKKKRLPSPEGVCCSSSRRVADRRIHFVDVNGWYLENTQEERRERRDMSENERARDDQRHTLHKKKKVVVKRRDGVSRKQHNK